MATIEINNGKLKNPIALKLILEGKKNKEIVFESPLVITAKQSFCIIHIAEHYLANKSEYGDPNNYMNFLTNNFQNIKIETNKGVQHGSDVNSRFLNKVKKVIDVHILMEMKKRDQIKFNTK